MSNIEAMKKRVYLMCMIRKMGKFDLQERLINFAVTKINRHCNKETTKEIGILTDF